MKKLMRTVSASVFSALLLMAIFVSKPVLAADSAEKQSYYKNLSLSKYPEELKKWYKSKKNEDLNLKNPKTYTQKIQWLKLYDSTPIKTRLADKYLVRDFIKEKIGEEYLVPLLGVWDKFDDIDFDKLPNRFALKCNHGSGYNLIVKDKSKLDKFEAKKKFDAWMNEDFAYKSGFELHYKNIPHKIIAEEYLENNDQELDDYKVWCSNGEPECIAFMSNRFKKIKKTTFDLNWNLLPFSTSSLRHQQAVPRPKNLEKMIELAKKLCEGFSLVRVDFYVLNDGSLKFGELTFTPASGIMNFYPAEYNKILGDKVELPKEKYDYKKLFKTPMQKAVKKLKKLT